MLFSLAYLGFKKIEDIEKMTLNEYYLRLEAYQLQQVEVRNNLSLQAFFNQAIQATKGKKNPKPKYNKLSDLYDADAEIEEIRHRFEGRPSKRILERERNQIISKRYEEYHARMEGRREMNGRKL